MVGTRKQPDGTVAERLYCRTGKRVTAFWYKHPDNTTEVLASAPTARPDKVAAAKAQALQRWADLRGLPEPDGSSNTLANLFGRYFAWQVSLPRSSSNRKADSTLAGNRRESVPLLAVFGHMAPDAVTTPNVYGYIDARGAAGAPKAAVKEVALLSAVYGYGLRIGKATRNPCLRIKHERAAPSQRLVTWAEIEHVTAVGRARGGTAHLVALALRAAWLAFKRPGEVLVVPRSAYTDAGLLFEANKRRKSQGRAGILIRWSPVFRATVDEAMGLDRWKAFGGDRLIFGNLAGHAYTRSGWGTELRKLMAAALAADQAQAEQEGRPPRFAPFSLRDCRAGGITSKMERGERDVYDGTGHADARMVNQVYDRRTTKVARPAG
jgi:integrase